MEKKGTLHFMIKDKLIAIFEARFGKDKFRVGSADEPAITFPAAHPAVGDLQIWDDGDEAMVVIAEITHGHFSCFEKTRLKMRLNKKLSNP